MLQHYCVSWTFKCTWNNLEQNAFRSIVISNMMVNVNMFWNFWHDHVIVDKWKYSILTLFMWLSNGNWLELCFSNISDIFTWCSLLEESTKFTCGGINFLSWIKAWHKVVIKLDNTFTLFLFVLNILKIFWLGIH
jgi:hypothetical protein